MNYCIINGKDSRDINGLLIQSLPSISKPLIRTQVEQIDGRDGDIVKKLGYSAYDKEMTIALHGNYDVDHAIKFFDSEGIVCFSNECDKFYRFQIINQIDFERLIRYKTATVTFHVQPFKLSYVDRKCVLNNQFIEIPDFEETKSGVTLSAENGLISVSGTATEHVELYLPIVPAKVKAGDYTLKAKANGTNPFKADVSLIGYAPYENDTFGGTYITLENETVRLTDESDAHTFHYLYFEIDEGDMDFTAKITFQNDDVDNFQVINRGNVMSKPKLTIYGEGQIDLFLNGIQIFTISLGNLGYITIDAEEMNAYKDDSLMNRYVIGDYRNLMLNIGNNTISWSGDVERVEVEDFSRWI